MTKETKGPDLTAADIDAIPAPAATGLKPGDIVGEGVAAERVPYTREWFLDIEARRKDLSPEYQLHEFIPNETTDVSVNGVAFRILAGRPCKLPSPHYQVYMGKLQAARELEEKYSAPNGAKPMQVYRMDGVWRKEPIE